MQLGPHGCEFLAARRRVLSGGRVALLQQGNDELFDHPGFTFRRDLVHTQMTWLDPELCVPGRQTCDGYRVLVIHLGSAE